jgi:hypothetical protein
MQRHHHPERKLEWMYVFAGGVGFMLEEVVNLSVAFSSCRRVGRSTILLVGASFLRYVEVCHAVSFCVWLQSIVTYTQRMQAAGKEPIIEPPMHQQPTAGAQEADQDSDEEERWVQLTHLS